MTIAETIHHWADQCFISLRDRGVVWDSVTGHDEADFEKECREIIVEHMQLAVDDAGEE